MEVKICPSYYFRMQINFTTVFGHPHPFQVYNQLLGFKKLKSSIYSNTNITISINQLWKEHGGTLVASLSYGANIRNMEPSPLVNYIQFMFLSELLRSWISPSTHRPHMHECTFLNIRNNKNGFYEIDKVVYFCSL